MLTESGLTVITGTMFSGKSTELIRRIRRLEAADFRTQLFKPKIDDRYALDYVISHDGFQKEATYINSVIEMIANLEEKTQVIGIDEVQFLDSRIVEFCDQQAMNRIVLVAGLAKNFHDMYFPFSDEKLDMSELLRIADHTVPLNAICTYQDNGHRCRMNATRVQKFSDGEVAPFDSPIVQVGGKEAYEPRCRLHFQQYQEVLDRLKT
ncbi:thymidine kinase [Candidatus Woesearchaeota archaeon]|nr:thymidine kinase [Candidatus Woesearchaeota archaeon]